MPMGWVAAATAVAGYMSSNAANNASDAQQQAAQASQAEQQREFNVTQQNLAPYRQAGTNALNKMSLMLGLPGVGGAGGGSTGAVPGPHESMFNMQDNPNYGVISGANPYQAPLGSGMPALASSYKRAMGGDVGAPTGQSYVVGEEGPEVLHMAPGAMGYVDPNPATKARMGLLQQDNVGMSPMKRRPRPELQGRAGGGWVGGMPISGPFTPAPNAGPAKAPAATPGAGTKFTPNGGNYAPLQSGQTPMSFMEQDPSYQYQFQQGQYALDSSAAAQGNLLSGGHSAALVNYGQQMASNDFSNIYNRLAALAGTGQAATTTQGQLGLYNGMGIANSLQYGGNAAASGYMNSANAINGTVGNLAYLYGYNQQQNPGIGTTSVPTQTPIDWGATTVDPSTTPITGGGMSYVGSPGQ